PDAHPYTTSLHDALPIYGRSRTAVGSTVDVANATWTNTIGAGEMITVWKDPDFDPALRAFYYVRVIEIPTPRWTAYDARYFGIKDRKSTRLNSSHEWSWY